MGCTSSIAHSHSFCRALHPLPYNKKFGCGGRLIRQFREFRGCKIRLNNNKKEMAPNGVISFYLGVGQLLKHSLYLLCNGLAVVAELLVQYLEWSRVAEVVEAVDEALLAYQTDKVDREA